MKLKFTIDRTYLISHTLSSMASDRFSSPKYKEDIVAFQNFAWEKSQSLYNFLIARFVPESWLDSELSKLEIDLPKYIIELQKSKEFKRLLSQTQSYLKACELQWKANYQKTLSLMESLTGLRFDKTFSVFITHPSLKNGCNLGKNRIAWGHCENWPNYTTVYLWHEILHSYFSNSDRDHVIISLLTDQELRIRLNSGKYNLRLFHKELRSAVNKVLPDWQNYLKLRKKDIKILKKKWAKRN